MFCQVEKLSTTQNYCIYFNYAFSFRFAYVLYCNYIVVGAVGLSLACNMQKSRRKSWSFCSLEKEKENSLWHEMRRKKERSWTSTSIVLRLKVKLSCRPGPWCDGVFVDLPTKWRRRFFSLFRSRGKSEKKRSLKRSSRSGRADFPFVSVCVYMFIVFLFDVGASG